MRCPTRARASVGVGQVDAAMQAPSSMGNSDSAEQRPTLELQIAQTCVNNHTDVDSR